MIHRVFLFVFWLFRAVPTAYESSQARGRIRATAAGLRHSHMQDLSHICNLNHSSRQRQIPDPLNTEQGRVLNPHPHGYWSDLFPLYHSGNSDSQLFIYLFIYFFLLFRSAHSAYGSSQARGPVGAVAAGLHHSHSNTRSELCLQSTPQFTALGSLTQ